jgi:hypothetical protein
MNQPQVRREGDVIRDLSETKFSEVDDIQLDSVLSSIGRTVNSSSDIVSAFSELEAQIQQLVHFDRITVTLLDDDGSVARIVGVAGVDVPQHGVDDELTLVGTLPNKLFSQKPRWCITMAAEKRFATHIPECRLTPRPASSRF